MISIFILIGAYRYYASLAEAYNKTKWHYGVLAIAIYIISQLVFGVCYGIYLTITDPSAVNDMSYTGYSVVNMVGWVLALILVYVVYKILLARFKKERAQIPTSDIDLIGTKEEHI